MPELFARVPEPLLDAEVSDRAVRLFALLDRYAGRDGRAYPMRSTLAERLRCSVSSVDRALDELVESGSVVIESGKAAGRSNHYVLTGCVTHDAPPTPPMTHPSVTGDAPVPHECDTPYVTGDAQKESHQRKPATTSSRIETEAQRRIDEKRAAGVQVGAGLERIIRKEVADSFAAADRERDARRALEQHACTDDRCSGGWIYVTENGNEVASPCPSCKRNAA